MRSLRGMDIRPTADRLREALFNVLTAGQSEALLGSVWLDLFAGTGAVGIEALSRGASQVSFVESSAAAARVVRQNLPEAETWIPGEPDTNIGLRSSRLSHGSQLSLQKGCRDVRTIER